LQLLEIQGQDGVFRQNPVKAESDSEDHTPPASKQDWQEEHKLKAPPWEQEFVHSLLLSLEQSQPYVQEHEALIEMHVPEKSESIPEGEVHFPPASKHCLQFVQLESEDEEHAAIMAGREKEIASRSKASAKRLPPRTIVLRLTSRDCLDAFENALCFDDTDQGLASVRGLGCGRKARYAA
jgi:hypothetical protein